MNTTPVFTGALGLNTVVDASRLPVSESGRAYLVSCVNTDLDVTGGVFRRKGYSLERSESWHSLFSGSEYMIGVSGDALCIIRLGGTGLDYTPIRNVTPGMRTSFVAVREYQGVQGDVIFHCNGVESGKIIDGVAYDFSTVEYVGPDTTREFTAPFTDGKLMEVHQSRLLIAKGNGVWFSEEYAYEQFSMDSGLLPFPGEVVSMVSLAPDALFVGTDVGGWLVKDVITAPTLLNLFSFGCIAGGVKKLDKSVLPMPSGGALQWPALVVTRRGMMMVDASGTVLDISGKALKDDVFKLVTACSVCWMQEQHKFIVVLEE